MTRSIGLHTIVIDAGHGGDDPGAVGKKSKEKDISLSIAIKLGNIIKANMPDVKVIYTRSTDKFVELYKRAKIANENKADLFISIHCNSTKTSESSGTETWVMGLHKSNANLEVAKKENASILMENDYSQQYDGFDPNSPEANIIFSLYQNIYLDQSLNLAAKVQNQFTKSLGRVNRGVKQAGFLVLFKTTMPGILVEAGFISNANEEDFLISDKGQNLIASAIYRAIKEYKNNMEGKQSPADTSFNNRIIIDTVKNTPIVIVKNNDTTTKNANPLNLNDTSKLEVFFKVQISASSSKKPLNSPDFKGLHDLSYYLQDGIYKYTVGNEKTLEDAVILMEDVHKKGFKDAFVVAFRNGQRISPKEAILLLKK